MMDEHEKAMREAAKECKYGCIPFGDVSDLCKEVDGLLDLIREQVRRMDETCVSSGTSWNGVIVVTGCKDAVNANCVYCPTCGKRIKVEAKKEKETIK